MRIDRFVMKAVIIHIFKLSYTEKCILRYVLYKIASKSVAHLTTFLYICKRIQIDCITLKRSIYERKP